MQSTKKSTNVTVLNKCCHEIDFEKLKTIHRFFYWTLRSRNKTNSPSPSTPSARESSLSLPPSLSLPLSLSLSLSPSLSSAVSLVLSRIEPHMLHRPCFHLAKLCIPFVQLVRVVAVRVDRLFNRPQSNIKIIRADRDNDSTVFSWFNHRSVGLEQ